MFAQELCWRLCARYIYQHVACNDGVYPPMQISYKYFSQNTATELVPTFVLIIQMGKLRHREAKLLASKQQITGRVENRC